MKDTPETAITDDVMEGIKVAVAKHLECGFKLRHGRMMRGIPVYMNSEYRKVTIQQSDGSGRTFYLSEIVVYDWPPQVMQALGHSKELRQTDWRSEKTKQARGGAHPENPEAFKP